VPLPKINWEDPRKLEKLNKLVDEILETKARLASGDSRQRELQEQSELLDETIDELVFDLYGLTQSEKDTIVSSLKERQDTHKDAESNESPSLFE